MGIHHSDPILASTTTSTSGATGWQVMDAATWLHVAVDVTAASGTVPVLDLDVEWSTDLGTTPLKGSPDDAFPIITGPVKLVKTFTIKAKSYRVAWTLSGTLPSFTFSLAETLT
jgi:hypothetical protein